MRYLVIILLLTRSAVYAQNAKITGQVTDTKNNPITYATVDVIGKNSTNTTDELGRFVLSLNDIKQGDIITLKISKEGYKTAILHSPVSPLSIPIKLLRLKNFKALPVTPLEPKPDAAPIQPTYVTSFGQNGGITAAQVTIGPQPRVLNLTIQNQLLSLNKDEKIQILSVMNNAESYGFADQIEKFLKSNGYKKVTNYQGVWTPPTIGQTMTKDTSGTIIRIGALQ